VIPRGINYGGVEFYYNVCVTLCSLLFSCATILDERVLVSFFEITIEFSFAFAFLCAFLSTFRACRYCFLLSAFVGFPILCALRLFCLAILSDLSHLVSFLIITIDFSLALVFPCAFRLASARLLSCEMLPFDNFLNRF